MQLVKSQTTGTASNVADVSKPLTGPEFKSCAAARSVKEVGLDLTEAVVEGNEWNAALMMG